MSALLRMARQAFQATWGTATTALARLTGRESCSFPTLLSPGDPPVFPNPARSDRLGLIAHGGDLSVARLVAAYRAGIFPWYDDTTPILWWSPDPRAIFELTGLHVSRRLARTVRSGRFRVTLDQAFVEVLHGCATRAEGTWILPEMMTAYETLHQRNHAHSIEVWCGDDLAGGVYGVTLGGLFAGESMFSQTRDASKVALVHLVEHLRERGYVLFDIQYLNDHTRSLGGIEIPRTEYLSRLAEAIRRPVTFEGPGGVSSIG